MSLFYSRTTGGFYDEAVHGQRFLSSSAGIDSTGPIAAIEPNPNCGIPADAVAVTREVHRALMMAQATGMEITAGADGAPIATPVPFHQLREARLATFRAGRETIINRLMGLAARAQRSGNAEAAMRCDNAVEMLLQVPGCAELTSATSLVDLDAAIENALVSILSALPTPGESLIKDVTL